MQKENTNALKSTNQSTQQVAIHPPYYTFRFPVGTPPAQISILRIKDVIARTGLGRSTIYKYISMGKFPKPFILGQRATGWKSTDIDNFIVSLTVGAE